MSLPSGPPAPLPVGLSRAEMLRKFVHVGSLAPALLLPWLTWPLALGMALTGAAFGLFVLPLLGGKALWRPAELAAGRSLAIVLYPLSVALLVLTFRERLGIVAAGWALLAAGDGAASLAGRAFGRRLLPWGSRKTLEGLLAHVMAGTAAATLLLLFVGDPVLAAHRAPVALAFGVGLAAALGTALIETADLGVDDNLTVPLLGGALCWLGLAVAAGGEGWDAPELLPRAGLGLVLTALLALAAVRRGSLARSGGIAAVLVGTVTWTAGGAAAFGVLLGFYLLGTAATRLGRGVKEARGIAEARGGRRAAGNVLANGGLAAAAALLIPGGGSLGTAAAVALVAALATAAFDTVSSEVGKAYGRRTFLVTTLRPVPPGTEGAVSLEGTLAGLAAAVGLALPAAVMGLLPAGPLPPVAVVIGALVGTTFESVAGAALAARGRSLDNDLLNFLNTAVGAGAAVLLLRAGTVFA